MQSISEAILGEGRCVALYSPALHHRYWGRLLGGGARRGEHVRVGDLGDAAGRNDLQGRPYRFPLSQLDRAFTMMRDKTGGVMKPINRLYHRFSTIK